MEKTTHKNNNKIGFTPSIPSSYKGLTIAILNKLSLKSNNFFVKVDEMSKDYMSLLASLGSSFLEIMLCSLPILLFCVQSI